MPFAAIAGLLHGYAFGEEVLGADGPVIAAYIIGVAVACVGIALAVMLLASKILALSDPGSRVLRIAGALISVLGTVLLAQMMVGT